MSGAMNNPLGPGMPMPGGDPVNLPGTPAPQPGGGVGLPGVSPGLPSGPVPGGGNVIHNALRAEHGRAKAGFENLSQALGRVDKLKGWFQGLSEKGDMVRPEDVVSEAGKLVSHGIDPMALAGILADMPQEGGGEALAGWLADKAVKAEIAEQRIQNAHAEMAHQLASSSMRMMMAHDIDQSLVAEPPKLGSSGPSRPSNQLMPGADNV